MLIQCPKCKFQQPQDQYCARCGIDMQSYKPEEKNKVDRTLESSTLKFALIVFIGFILVQSILRSDVTYKWIQKINRFASLSKEKQFTPESIDDSNLNSNNPLLNENSTELTSSTVTVSSAAAVSETEQSNKNEKIKKIQFKIIAYEVDKNNLEQIISKISNNSFILNSSEQHVFLINNFEILKNELKSKELLTTHLTINENEDAHYWIGNESKESPIGIDLFFAHKVKPINPGLPSNVPIQKNEAASETSTNLENNQLLKLVDFVLSKKHPSDLMQINFTLYEQHLKNTIIIADHKILSYFELETDLENIALFQFSKSENYRNQNSTLIFVIEPQ